MAGGRKSLILLSLLALDGATAAPPRVAKESKASPALLQQHYDEAFQDYSKNDFSRAIRQWEEILKLDPDQTTAQKMILMARNQIALQEKARKEKLLGRIREGRYKTALRDLQSLLGKDPGNPSYLDMQDRLEKVVEVCPEAPSSGTPPWRAAVLGMADYLEKPDRPQFAYDALRYARELDPEDKKIPRLLDLLLAARPALADDKIPSGMKLIDYKLFLALNYIYDGKYHLAVEGLEQVLRLQPDHLLALKRLGSAYFALGRKKEARGAWSRALRLDPRNAQLKKFLASLQKE